ncbi:MAG: hypothetical protein IJ626_00575 [Muribaculaceae bacterium]|nr:hypothetical protein [Muribaculaceae bacterium]
MKLFIFAIGGTGSRVLKSLVMLSAAGVKPVDENGTPLMNFEIVPVIIDPHKSCADLKRTESLLNAYCDIRRQLHGDKVNARGFFANRILKLHDLAAASTRTIDDSFIFNLNAVEHHKFREFIGYDTMNQANQALTSLLFADYQLENKMSIGFVGSPNIGSVALNEIKDSEEFKAFANAFSAGDRIFFISSIFGGTGAAGFPIMVKNIRQAQNTELNNKEVLRRAPIGGLTVLPYFSIDKGFDPNDRRIDTADFIIKTQSALEYYDDTLTGNNASSLNAIFYLGDKVLSRPYEYDPGDKRDQKDPAHFIELIGALAPFKFAGMPDSTLSDFNGLPLPTKAFEYGLEKDTAEIDFFAMGKQTRALIFRRLVKLHMLFMYLRTGFSANIGQGYTEDNPKITREFLSSQFYRTLTTQFFNPYAEWLHEMLGNQRSVHLFNMGAENMGEAIFNVKTKKTLFGSKSVNNDVVKAELNRISRDNHEYDDGNVAFKLLDLFDQAAEKIATDRFDNIN